MYWTISTEHGFTFFFFKNTLAQRLQIEMLPSHLILFHSQQAKPSKEKPFKRPLPSVCFGWRTRPRPVTSRHSLPLRSTLLYTLHKQFYLDMCVCVPSLKQSDWLSDEVQTLCALNVDQLRLQELQDVLPVSNTASCPHGHTTTTATTAFSILTPHIPVINARHLQNKPATFLIIHIIYFLYIK